MFRAIFPILPKPDNDLAIISILFLIVLVATSVVAGVMVEKLQTRSDNATNKNIVGLVVIITGFLFVGQAFVTVGVLRQTIKESSYHSTAELSQKSSGSSSEKPDIYYIVLDRYTSNSVLKSQFNFDNSDFLNSLREQGFTVNDDAMSQYPYTTASIASTLNLSYHNDDVANFKGNSAQAATLFHNMIRQAEVVKILKQQGYSYYNLGSNYGATNKAPLADVDQAGDRLVTIFNKTKILRGLEVNAFWQSPFYRFFNINLSWWPLKSVYKDNVAYTANQINILKDLAQNKTTTPRFIFAHIIVPHDPFALNADGSISNNWGSDNWGKAIKQKYVDQIKFLNNQMQTIVKKIQEQSQGKAIILLNADEGAYPTTMNQTIFNPISNTSQDEIIFRSSMLDWPTKDLLMKYGILQAVYIPKAKAQDLSNISSVNLFRIVLNNYFGYSFSYLPDCQLALTDGRNDTYKYQDVTSRTSGQDNALCKQYE